MGRSSPSSPVLGRGGEEGSMEITKREKGREPLREKKEL